VQLGVLTPPDYTLTGLFLDELDDVPTELKMAISLPLMTFSWRRLTKG